MFTAEYRFERQERGEIIGSGAGFQKLNTHRVPLGVKFFHPSGVTAELDATHVDQDGGFVHRVFDVNDPVVVPGSDDFWTLDLNLRYRLPQRLGIFEFGVRNLFDEDLNFEDTDPTAPTIARDRLVFGRLLLAF